MIGHLLARTVDDVRHLIGNDELLVLHNVRLSCTYLGGEAIAYKQSILDLDGPDHVLGERLHHTLVHHLIHLHLHHLLVHLLCAAVIGTLVLPARSLFALFHVRYVVQNQPIRLKYLPLIIFEFVL